MKPIFLLIIILFKMTSCAPKYSMHTRKNQVVINTSSKTNTSIQNIHKNIPVKKTNGPKIPQKIVKNEEIISEPETTQTIIDAALSYLGTPYRSGGTTHKGMDCSGLMYTCFLVADIRLNRSSHEIAEQGIPITLNEVRIGDLLFFKTTRNKAIGHVGMVVEVGNSVKFIHSSTSRGVIISDLTEPYWDKAFVKAKRIL